MKMKIWTIGYFPFALGGDIHRPVACEVEVEGPHTIGHGYSAFIAGSPSGKPFIAESETGAIVGSSLNDVIADVASADVQVMAKQIRDARKQSARAELLPPETFWKMLRGA